MYHEGYDVLLATAEQKANELKNSIEEDMPKLNSLLAMAERQRADAQPDAMTVEDPATMGSQDVMAEERNILVPQRADAQPDAMTVEDPATMGSQDVMAEYARLEREQKPLETEMMKITLDIKRHMSVPPGMDHLTYMQNHTENLQEYLPFIVKQLDAEKALQKISEQLNQLLPHLERRFSELKSPENRPELHLIREKRSELQEELSKLQEQLSKLREKRQAEETSAGTINREIDALNIQLSEENEALETMKKDQASIQGRIDSIRGSI